MDAFTRKNQFDEREKDWLVQKFGLRQLQRLDAIQAETPFLLLNQEDKRIEAQLAGWVTDANSAPTACKESRVG